ncbi:lipopolysaccharide biosynthesis protein [Geothrix oryzisoli]|uniref:lipopolysaccharide biosynthesis protein n=1 Tax=Geothrix oryzisoli TaxID=2922721 RepID=UPI001FAC5A29|nr:lipopolysaccharide biosynthesis protein [Geothrix oryzisoli]
MTSATYALARGLSLIFPIVTIGIFIRSLGIEIYGLWMTVISFFVLFTFADLGLGFGLLTRLSNAYGRDNLEECRTLISTTFYILVLISVCLLVAIGAIFPWIPWSKILNASSERGVRVVPWIVALVVSTQIIQIPFSVIQRVQLAFQEGYKTSIWQSTGVFINLIAIVGAAHWHASPLWFILIATAIPLIFMILNWLYCFAFTLRKYIPVISAIDRTVGKSLMYTGAAFCFLTLLTSLGLSLDNLIVSRICGIQEVAAFSVASRIASVMGAVLVMLSVPMWSANGEALARGEYAWVHRQCFKIARLSLILAVSGTLGMIFLGPWAFSHWLGKELQVTRSLLGLCGISQALLATASPFFMVLNGAGQIRSQIRAFAVFTPIVLLVKILLAKYMGSEGVALGMTLVYGLGILPWVARKAVSICRPPSANPEQASR